MTGTLAARFRRWRSSVGRGRYALVLIARGGGVLCTLVAVTGIVLIAIADRAPGPPIDQPAGEVGLVMFIFGVIAPFGFWSVHLAVEQWVDETGEFFSGQYSRPVTIAASTAFGLLAVGIFTFALSPLLALTDGDGTDVVGPILWVMGGSICLAIIVSAIAGGVALFGWPGAVVGALTGLGFTVLVAGLVLPDRRSLVVVGVVLLVLGVAGFWAQRLLAWGAGRDV